ncbi:MAG: 3-hydroxyacyl-CoA dehydrogenase family protein [Desulfobacterales bacterium]|jgi:3-hydroxybutyryl-CoA dehydrogenase
MELQDVKKVTVMGAGIMGQGIAHSFIMGGFDVMLYNPRQPSLDIAMAHIKNNMQDFINSDLISQDEAQRALSRLTPTLDFEKSAEDCDFMMETVPENLELKQELFARFETKCPAYTILATNTSDLPPLEIFKRVNNSSRTIMAHWFNPPHLMPTVEVAKLPGTDPDYWDLTVQVIHKAGKQAIKVAKPVQGLIVNRIAAAILREALDLVEQGVADAQDIDDAIKGSLAFRSVCVGFIKAMDLGGLDAFLDMATRLLPEISNSTSPPENIQALVNAGHFGIRSGKGFYDYDVKFTSRESDPAIIERDQMMLKLTKIFNKG